MEFAPFDRRRYPTLPVREGYGEWARTYEDTVVDLLDRRLLARLRTLGWAQIGAAADLACGTGRVGEWLRAAGVAAVDGIDCTEAMLARAREKGVYRQLALGDMTASGFAAGAYDLVTAVLVDEHVADLCPLYAEAARLAGPAGRFVLVGYHPHFLMLGIITHFDRQSGDPVAIESHVHLMADHVAAARAAGWQLDDMVEGVIDEAWAAAKPKWFAQYRSHPVSFAMVWRRPAR